MGGGTSILIRIASALWTVQDSLCMCLKQRICSIHSPATLTPLVFDILVTAQGWPHHVPLIQPLWRQVQCSSSQNHHYPW